MTDPLTKLRRYPEVDAVGLRAVLSGIYDIPGLEFKTPPRILDIGANVGAATIWFAERYQNARIYAYEPSSQACDAWCENVGHNPFATLYPVAVVGNGKCPKDGRTKLYEGLHGPGERSTKPSFRSNKSGEFEWVMAMPASQLPPADIIKLDSEGCEVEILQGYNYLDDVTAVMLEWHSEEDYKLLKEWLPSIGLTLVADNAKGQWVSDREMLFCRGR